MITLPPRPARLLPLAVLLSACAATQGPPRLSQEPDGTLRYAVEAAGTAEGKNAARGQVRQAAEAHCAAQGLVIEERLLASGISDYLYGGEVDLFFRCQPPVAMP